MLSRKFQTLIVPHATEALQQPSGAAQAAATDFCAHVVALASEQGRRETSQMLLLVMYHELFDVGPASTALSHELNR